YVWLKRSPNPAIYLGRGYFVKLMLSWPVPYHLSERDGKLLAVPMHCVKIARNIWFTWRGKETLDLTRRENLFSRCNVGRQKLAILGAEFVVDLSSALSRTWASFTTMEGARPVVPRIF